MSSRHRSSRYPDRLARLGDRLGQARLVLLGALLIGLPFGLGGRAEWVLPAVGLANAVALALLALEMAVTQRRLRLHVAWLIAGLLLAVLCLQLVPAPGLASRLSPNAVALWQRAREAGLTDLTSRLSLTPWRSRIALLLLAQIGLTGWLIYNTFTTRRRLIVLSACVAGAALANALGAFAPTFLGTKPLYASLGIVSKPLSGTFLNRNHFGCLLAMGLLQLAGLAWVVFRARAPRTERSGSLRRTLEEDLERRRGPLLLLLALAAVPVAMGLVFSLSRGAAAGATLALVAFILLGTRGNSGASRRALLVVTGLFLAAVMVGAIEALTDLWDRYEAVMTLGNIGLEGRTTVWRETLELLRRFPLCGMGLDAFERVSPLVESGFSAGKISFHAHNDYLELLAEAGLPLGILCLLLVLAALVQCLRRACRCRDLLCRTLGIAAWCGLLAVALHEGVDYSLRAPANAFLAVALAVLCLLASEVRGNGSNGGNGGNGGNGSNGRSHANGRQAVRALPRGVLARLGLAGAALAALGAGLWFYPRQIRAGTRLMALRAVVGATAERENTGAARKTQATYCIGQAEAILRDLPANERALYYRADYQATLVACISQELGGRTVTPEDRAAVEAAVFASRAAARQLCQEFPVSGYYQARYARELDFSAWYDKGVAIPGVVRAFETAHANYPHVPQVSAMCLAAFTEILAVDRDVLSVADLERVEGLVAALGTALLEQQPDRSAEVLRQLQRVFPDPEKLIAVTPRRLLCYQPLYELFFMQGRYEQCAALIDAMECINQDRLTRRDTEEITLYELTRTPPQSREETAADLARRRLTLAGARGAGADYVALREAETAARRALAQPLIAAAAEAAAAGDYYRALRQGRAVLARFPEAPEINAHLAGWLLSVGERAKALEHLEALMTARELPQPAIDEGLEALHRLLQNGSERAVAACVADVLRVRQAQHQSAEQRGDLKAVQERLTAWAKAPGQTAAVARFGHVALYHAGLAADLSGDQVGAAALYQEALALCSLHRPSVEQLLALPPGVADAAQGAVRAQLGAAGLRDADLHRDLVEPAVGVALRQIVVAPASITPTEAVRLSVAVEITGEVAGVPVLRFTFACADGSCFPASIGAKQWLNAPERPRLGELLVAQADVVPAIAALQAGHGLPEGPVILRLQGVGRDAGFTFHYPAFTVRHGEEPAKE
jgi:O-antigen ligase